MFVSNICILYPILWERYGILLNTNHKKDKSSSQADENSTILYSIQAKWAIGNTKAKVDTKGMILALKCAKCMLI